MSVTVRSRSMNRANTTLEQSVLAGWTRCIGVAESGPLLPDGPSFALDVEHAFIGRA